MTLKNKTPFSKKRGFSSYLSEHDVLLELAPCSSPVAGLHRASPSTTLDKKIY
jgi:hypothetical protein